jgi:hypothetical protein
LILRRQLRDRNELIGLLWRRLFRLLRENRRE